MNTKSRINIKYSLYRTFAVFMIVMLALAAMPMQSVQAATITDTFTTAGTFSWTAPLGVTSVNVQVWGGGGGGGTRTTTGNGGGGGGGAYSLKNNIPVTPGTNYSVRVGAAGTPGTNAGDSYFINTGTVLAQGGRSVANNTATGAAGGQALSSVGDLVYSGGTGATGAGTYGGGGGSSAGSGAIGGNGATSNGGTAPTGGGNGGNGRTGSSGNGSAGIAPGGGGGGSYRTGGGTQNGGNGAPGQVIITYTMSLASSVAVLDPWPAAPQFTATTGNPSGTFTISAGSNRLLVVAVDIADSFPGTTGHTYTATYGGMPLTQAARENSNRRSTWIGYLNEADIASRSGDTLSVSITGNHTGAVVYVASYSGVNQTAPITQSDTSYDDNNTTVEIGPLSVTPGGYGVYTWAGTNGRTRTSDTEGYTEYDDAGATYGDLTDFGIAAKPITTTSITNPIITWSGGARTSISFITFNPAPPKTDQTIVFGALTNKTNGDPDFVVSAVATSGLAVSFSSQTASTCTVTGNLVHIVQAGTCTIRASQAGNGSYNPAPNVDQSFTISPAITGTTYYVNNTNANCSDTLNTGLTIPLPFCTIGRGVIAAVAGDTVRVLAGTYPETVTMVRSGSPGSPISFLAEPGVTVTGAASHGFRVSSWNYITIDGFNVTDTTGRGIYVSTSDHIIISNNHISLSGSPVSGSTQPGIHFDATTNSTISGNTTHHNSSYGIYLSGASNGNTVSDNISFANAQGWQRVATGINVYASNNNTILHNITYANEDTGIQLYSNSTGNLVIGNLTYGNADHGIDLNTSPNNTIVGNTVQGNYTSGINVEGNSTGVTIANNIAVDNGINIVGSGQPGNIRVDATSTAGSTINYDIVFLTGVGTSQIQWNGTNYATLALFRSAFPAQEVNGLQANPFFVAPAAPAVRPNSGNGGLPAVNVGDYHIASTSPAIDSANSNATGEPLLDIEGNPRVDTPVANTGAGVRTYDDRGAYELQTGGALPVVTTEAVTAIGTTTASGNGTISNLGAPNPYQHGVVWDTAANPTIALATKTTQGTANATGAFTSAITGLTPGTLYHVRAYATNTAGTSYGADVSFAVTTTSVVTSGSPSVYGTPVTFTATVFPATATGTVTFFDGATVLGTGTLSAGTATLSISTLSVSGSPHSITATLAGSGIYGSSTSSPISQTITPATLTYTANPASRIYGAANPAFSGTVTGFVAPDTQLTATTGTLSFTSTATTTSNVGSYAITGSGLIATNGNYTFVQAADNATALTITPATPVITWLTPADITYGTALSATQLNASTSVAGTFAYTPVSGTILNAGNGQTLSADFISTDPNYVNVLGTTVNINVLQATPVITWETPADITYGTALGVTQLNALSPVAGTFEYTPAYGTVLNAGNGQTLSVDFTSADPNYKNVLGVTVSINVLQATPVITWATPADITYGTALSATQLNSSTPVTGTFAYTPGSGTVLNAGNGQTLSVDFTSTDPNYKSVLGATVLINVLQATPVITWATPADITYGTALSATQLNASSSVAGTFAYTPASGTVLNAGNGQMLSADFTSTDPNYKDVLGATVSINVLQATPVVTWATPADITYGTALGATQLNASSPVAGTFAYTPVSGTILNAGNGQTLSADFTSTDPNYKNVLGVTVSINVLQATPLITWATPVDIAYGTALSATQLNASTSVAGTFEYTPASGTILNAGNGQTLSVDFISADPNYKNVLGVTVSINVLQATPLITWATPADITYGTALSATQLNASSPVAGTFAYTPASGTILNAGNGQMLSADFTSTDPNYKNVLGATVKINVLQATPPFITWPTPADIMYGTALSATQLNASTSVAGTFEYTPASGTILNAGNGQTLSVDFTSTDPNYKNVLGITVSINVLQATPLITWATPADITYGTVLSATQLNASSPVTGTFEYTPVSGTILNVGNGQTLSADFTSADPNYKNVLGATVLINVLQATPLITWTTPADITYGTALSATQLNASSSVAGTFAYTPASGTILNAGNGQTLSAEFTSTDPNYENMLGNTVSINVIPASLTITASNATMAFGGTVPTITPSYSGLQAGDTAPATVPTCSTTATNTSPVGSYSSICTGAADANYNISYAPGSVTITPEAGIVVLGDLAQTYDGTPKSATVTTTPPNLSINVTYGGLATVPTNAGSYTVVATITDTNYSGSASNTLIIGPATVTPGITASNKIYDGSTTASFTCTLTGVIGSDDVNCTGGTANFSDLNVGTWTVTAAGLGLSGADSANYELSSTSAANTADITQRTLNVTAAGVNKTYDGTTAATVTLADDRVGGDAVTTAYTTASFVDPNIGTGITVNVSGISITGGANSGNYALGNTTATTTANITNASQTITVVTSAPASASNTSNFDVKATASSGLPVTITTSGSCSGGGTNGTATVTMTSGSGTCSVFYDQDGVPNYSAAPQIQENVTATEGPVFTSADKTSFDVGFLGNFNITAAGNPSTMTISVSGTLPAGVSFTNNGDGTADFVGTPVLGAQGTYNLILTANNGVAPNATQNFTLTVRNGPVVAPAGINSTPDTGNGSISENEAIIDTLGITKISVEFSRDVYNPANDTDVNDVTNPANYLLVRSSSSVFQTASCDAGPVAPDVTIAVDSVTYSNGGGSGPFISTLSINGGFPLNVVGFYRLYVCGTTSIVDATNTNLILAGDGTTPGTDFQRNFHIMSQISDNGDNGGGKNKGNTTAALGTSELLIPVTGFAPDQVTILPVQPSNKAYKSLNEIRIEIPTLGINFPIVGVALNKNSWDLTWLQNSVGYLEGSAYPTWSGNTVLSAHVLDAYKNLGPFSDIKGMQLGQKIYIHFNKQVYVYQVQENRKILPSNISAVFKHEEDSWVTLVTCEDFNAKTGLYTTRRLVRAVLISVITEK